jgi:hypothetical protein
MFRRCCAILLCATSSACAGDLDTVGVSLLRQFDPSLNGSGIAVAQPEGYDIFCGSPIMPFEVNPAIVGQPVSRFTYISSNGVASTFTNSVGGESCHANSVGGNFYGLIGGVATNIAHVDNYEANYFLNNVPYGSRIAITNRVVNQSFTIGTNDSSVDWAYDSYAATNGALFITGIGNGGPAQSPGTCYNGIGVGVYGGSSSYGPTPDGRSKPDLTAPGGQTSFSTPYVSGSAAVLLQSAIRGDGGANSAAANNARTIKALLLNGAVKPADWTNGLTTPLDARYGAGMLNLFNSWRQLKGGKNGFIEATTGGAGSAHPPGGNTSNEPVLVGWDTNAVSCNSVHDSVNHYYFNLTGTNSYTATITLTWNRHWGSTPTAINDLNLFLFETTHSNLVTCSTSLVDNVEHIFIPQLAPGRYDLQVLKHGSTVSSMEGYSLAFEFFNLPLTIVRSNSNVVLSWPASPAGFRLICASNLSPSASWSDVNSAITVNTNSIQDSVVLPLTNGLTPQFFRLQRP